MANEAQAEFWTNTVGHVWIANEARILLIGRSHGEAALDAGAPAPGERVLDIGCGTGPMTVTIADRVGPTGAVVGVDISPLLIEQAQRSAAGRDNVTFITADAQTADLGEGFDLVYSQFGVMFFEDPVAAFANLRRSLRDGGRLAFACWSAFFDNAWMATPALASGSVFPLTPPDPNAPGPFAFAEPDKVRSILEDAGFSAIDIRRRDDAAIVPMDEPDMDQAMRMGPMRDAYDQADPQTRQRAYAAILEASAQYAEDGGYRFPSASWTVTARR